MGGSNLVQVYGGPSPPLCIL